MTLKEHKDRHIATLNQLDEQRRQLTTQLNQTSEQILRLQGAVLAIDELLKEAEPQKETPENETVA